MDAIKPSAFSAVYSLQSAAAGRSAHDRRVPSAAVDDPNAPSSLPGSANPLSRSDLKAPDDVRHVERLEERQPPQVQPELLWVRQALADFIEQLSESQGEEPVSGQPVERLAVPGEDRPVDEPTSRSEASEQTPTQAVAPREKVGAASKVSALYQGLAAEESSAYPEASKPGQIDSKA